MKVTRGFDVIGFPRRSSIEVGRYREDQHGPCARVARTLEKYSQVLSCVHAEPWRSPSFRVARCRRGSRLMPGFFGVLRNLTHIL